MNERTDPDFTMGDAWVELAEKYGLHTEEQTDEDALTSNEFARKYGISRDRALAIIKQEHREGRVEITKKIVECFGGNRTTTVQAYKIRERAK